MNAEAIDNSAAGDLVEVVRCEDCAHFICWGDGSVHNECNLHSNLRATEPRGFCHEGERKMLTGHDCSDCHREAPAIGYEPFITLSKCSIGHEHQYRSVYQCNLYKPEKSMEV